VVYDLTWNACAWWPIPRCRAAGSSGELGAVIVQGGGPVMWVSDNGTEMTSMGILR
jgi:hypothetical protein